MGKTILLGHVETGFGDAKNWGIEEIRRVRGYNRLKSGTLNVKLDAPHELRPDFRLPRGQRTDGRAEDLNFERCQLLIGSKRVPALIAQLMQRNIRQQGKEAR